MYNRRKKISLNVFLYLMVVLLSFLCGLNMRLTSSAVVNDFQDNHIADISSRDSYLFLNDTNREIALISSFSEGLGIFLRSSDFDVKTVRGFITKNSEIFLESSNSPREFSEGYSMFVEGDGNVGFVDKSGQRADIPFFDYPKYVTEIPRTQPDSRWDKVTDAFSEGLAAVNLDSKWGLVNKQGKIIVQPQFEMAAAPSEGLAPVKLNKLWGFVDTTGAVVIEPQFEDAGGKLTDEYIFSEGRALVLSKGRFGYINPSGQIVIDAVFEAGGAFSEGLAPVQTADYKYGYVDALGNMAIEPKFDTASSFSEGLALASVGSKYGYIDETGQFVIEPKFDGGKDFSDGLAPIYLNGKWGYVDTMGSVVVEPQFKIADKFSEGVARVCPMGQPCFPLHKRDLIHANNSSMSNAAS